MKRAVFVALLLIGVLVDAEAASAHAELMSTTPAAGEVVPTSPSEIELHFTESVGLIDDAIELLDAEGEPVPAGEVRHPESSVLVLPVSDLDDGGYVVSWRVVSADSHPIQGAFVFYVGEYTGDLAAVSESAADSGSDVVGFLYGVVRWAVFVSLLILVGGAAFCAVVWPQGTDDRRARRVVGGAALTAVVATVAGLLLQGAYERGGDLGSVFDGDVLGEVIGSRFGVVWLLRLLLLGLAIGLLRRAHSRGVLIAGGVIGVMLLATPGLAGHASTGHWRALALPVDALHLAAASAWVGGLVMLTVCVLRADRNEELQPVVTRFSTLAFTSVVVLVATGAFQSWRQVSGLDQVTDTTFGRLLLAKLAAFIVVLGLAGLSRRWVLRHYRSPARDEALATVVPPVRAFRRSVAAEALVALAALAITAQLVAAPPARSAGATQVSEGSVTVEFDGMTADVVITPSSTGANQLHVITRDAEGALLHVEELRGTLRLAARSIGPIQVDLISTAHATFDAEAVQIPFPGDWELQLVATLSEFDERTGVAAIEVG